MKTITIIFWTAFIFGLLIPTASAIINLGIYEQGESINLLQTCNDCTFNNITTIVLGNKTVLNINEAMTKGLGNVYNWTLDYTQSYGTYLINGIGDDSSGANWRYTIIVGQELTTARAVSYIGFLIVLLFTFFLTIYGASQVRWKHLKSDEGKILSINHFRYVKIFLFSMAYLEIMFLFGLSYKLFNEANIEGFTQFFNFVYQLFLNLLYPLMVFLIIIVFVIWINNKKLNKKLKLGI
jgi:hypothetical protein